MLDESPPGDAKHHVSNGGEADLDDLLIIGQVNSGQKDLFRLLVRRYEKAVYGMGMSFFRNTEDASDFVQEVFLKAYRSLSRFEGRSRFSTWLYKIAYNTAVNGVKRIKEYHSLASQASLAEDADRLTTPGDSPERTLLRNAARDAIQSALKELPERFKACIDLFFFYDRSYQEIEGITGFPVNTVKSHVFRAKKLLREKLEIWS
jgi:RNA polymerase sigma-70 factor (ECF subfamily)